MLPAVMTLLPKTRQLALWSDRNVQGGDKTSQTPWVGGQPQTWVWNESCLLGCTAAFN